MTQVALLLLLYIFGLAVCLAWGPRRDSAVCCALALPVGVAAAGGLALGALFFDVPFSWGVAGGGLALFAAAIWTGRRRWRPEKIDFAIIAAGSTTFLGIVLCFWTYDVTLHTYGSHETILAGQALGAEGTSFRIILWHQLSERGPLIVASYGLGQLVNLDYLYALQPTLFASLVAFVAAVAWRGGALLGASRWVRSLAAGFGAVALACQPGLLHASFHVTSGALGAIYVTCFLGVFWLAEIREDATTAPVALLCLAALFLLSEVAALFGLVLFAVAVLPSPLTDELDVPVAAAVALLIAWLAATGHNYYETEKPRYFSAAEARRVFAALLGLYLVWVAARGPAARRVVRALPMAILIAAAMIAAAYVLAGVVGLDDMAVEVWRSLRHWVWHASWPAVVALAALGLLAGRMPGERLLACLIPLFGVVAISIAAAAPPTFFEAPLGELHMLSAQALPASILYLLLKLAWLLGEGRTTKVESPLQRPRRAELGAAFTALMVGLFLANIHQIERRQAWARRRLLAPVEHRSLLEAARGASNKIRARYAVHYLVASRTSGGTLRLARELQRHAPYLRHLAGMEVTVGDVLLPSLAAMMLRDRADRRGKIRTSSGKIRRLYLIFEEGVRDWVLAVTPDEGGPAFWMPRKLYLEWGGLP